MSFFFGDQSQEGSALPGADRRPIFTWGLLAINVVIFGVTALSGVSLDVNPDVLLKFGAMYSPLIATGDYWRLFTAMFLHAGITHLLFNSFGLLIFGSLVERIYGPARFLIIYILAGLAGSVASYSFNINTLVIGVGASGAIFGVMGALAAFFFARRDMLGTMGRQNLIGLLVIAGFNLVFGYITPGIDNWAHLGGLIGGAMIGLALAPLYQQEYEGALFGTRRRLVDANSLVKRWWIVPAALVVIAVGTWLATPKASGRGDSQSYLTASEEFIVQERFTNALIEINEAIDTDPTNGPAFFARSRLYRRLGASNKAQADFSTALRLGVNSRTP